MASKRSRTDLTMAQKKEICHYKKKNSAVTQKQISELFSLEWSTSIVRRTGGNILRRRVDWEIAETHQSKTKRFRKPKFVEVEEALSLWFSTMQAKKAIISDAILLEKGKYFSQRLDCAVFTASNSWLGRFKSRHGISLKILHGESASVNVDPVAAARSQLKEICSRFSPCDICNIDGTGLFF